MGPSFIPQVLWALSHLGRRHSRRFASFASAELGEDGSNSALRDQPVPAPASASVFVKNYKNIIILMKNKSRKSSGAVKSDVPVSTMHPIAEVDLVRLLIICRRYKWENVLPNLDALPSAKERVETFLNHVMPEISGPGWEEVSYSILRRQLLAGEAKAIYSLLRQAYDWDPIADGRDLHFFFNVTNRVAEWEFGDDATDFAHASADYNDGDLSEAPFIRFGANDLSLVLTGLAREMQILLPSWKLNAGFENLTAVLREVVRRKYMQARIRFPKTAHFDEEIREVLNGQASASSGERFYCDDALTRLALLLFAPSFTTDPVSFMRKVLHVPEDLRSDFGPIHRTGTCIAAARCILLQMVQDGFIGNDTTSLARYITARRSEFDIVDLALALGKERRAFRDAFLE